MSNTRVIFPCNICIILILTSRSQLLHPLAILHHHLIFSFHVVYLIWGVVPVVRVTGAIYTGFREIMAFQAGVVVSEISMNRKMAAHWKVIYGVVVIAFLVAVAITRDPVLVVAFVVMKQCLDQGVVGRVIFRGVGRVWRFIYKRGMETFF